MTEILIDIYIIYKQTKQLTSRVSRHHELGVHTESLQYRSVHRAADVLARRTREDGHVRILGRARPRVLQVVTLVVQPDVVVRVHHLAVTWGEKRYSGCFTLLCLVYYICLLLLSWLFNFAFICGCFTLLCLFYYILHSFFVVAFMAFLFCIYLL